MTFLFQLLAVSESLLFAEMQPIFATFVANLPIISVKSLSLCQVLTKVESRLSKFVECYYGIIGTVTYAYKQKVRN